MACVKQNTDVSFSSDANFCSECGSILPLPGEENYIHCRICSHKYVMSNAKSSEIHSSKVYNEERIALARSMELKNFEKEIEQSGPVTKRKCSNCGNDKMTYITRQTRSTDEGQTVFFTCTKCKFKETEYS
eukprot:gene7882-8733_t